MQTRNYLTDSDKKDIADMLQKHKSDAEIARWIGCGPSLIEYYRNKLGLPANVIRWTPAQKHKLLQMRADGKPVAEIAKTFKTTPNNIYSRLRLIRLKQNGD